MFAVGHRTGHISVSFNGGLIGIDISGEAPTSDLLTAAEICHQQGWLGLCDRFLVDMRGFTGTIDWACIRQLPLYLPALMGRRRTIACAHLLRPGYEAIPSILRGLMPGLDIRPFADDDAATLWLEERTRAQRGMARPAALMVADAV